MFNFQPSPELLKQMLGGQMPPQMPPQGMPPMGGNTGFTGGMTPPMGGGGLDVGAAMSRPMPMQGRQMMPPMQPQNPNPMPPTGGGGMMQKFAGMKRSNSKKRI